MSLRDLTRKLRSRAVGEVHRAWLTWCRRSMSEAEVLRYLEVTYAHGVPWNMESAKEQFRFAQTNRLLYDELIAPEQRVGSILEIGCGEGHQSEYLALLCDRLTGIDLVAAAVARARTRVPGADLIVGGLDVQPWTGERGRFDLITACEVLYYFKDIPKTLETISRLGRACLVTYYRPAAPLLERPLMRLPIAGRTTFVFGDVEWCAAWWRSGG